MGLNKEEHIETQEVERDTDRMVRHVKGKKGKKKSMQDRGREKWGRKEIKHFLKNGQFGPL